MLIGCMLAFESCQHLPESTRGGYTREVFIHERSPADVLQVNANDEVRWTNRQGVPVRITVLDYVLNNLSCRRNFSGHYYSGAEATLRQNESASLCFRKAGIVRYTITGHGILWNGRPNLVQVKGVTRHAFEQREGKASEDTRSIYTSWCEDAVITSEQCL